MTRRYDRRSFLRSAMAVGVVGPALPFLGCSDESRAGSRGPVGQDRIVRPILLPLASGAVYLSAPLSELPIAYVSRGTQRVYVDRDSRVAINVLLAAHISVSSGLWRIPLLGDDLRVPIPADDADREFEEMDISEWSPALAPVAGDFRIGWGRCADVTIEFDCVPLAGGQGWCSAGPLNVVRCRPGGEAPCLEAFMDIGSAMRHPRQYCEESDEEVRLMSWACPTP